MLVISIIIQTMNGISIKNFDIDNQINIRKNIEMILM